MADQAQNGLTIEDVIGEKRAQVMALASENGAYDIRIFGSVARGEATADSDIDILIGVNPTWSLLDRIRFKQALEDLLDIPVDVTTEATLHPRLRERVLKEAIRL